MFLALVLSPLGPVARWMADAAHPLLRAFDVVASAAASVPGASIAVAPSAGAVALGSAFAAALVTACVSRFPGRAMVVGAASLALLAWEPAATVGSGRTELHMIDVGQGDALALRTARGRWVAIDAGARWRGGDAGRSTVVPYVAHRGGPVAAFVLTSPASDHAGGAASVLQALHPSYFYDAASTRGGDAYRASLLAARTTRVVWRRAHPGDSLVVDDATLTFLGADSSGLASGRHANGGGMIIRVRVGAVRMLLLGDADRGAVRWLLEHDRDALAAEVLALGSHISDADVPPALLAAVSPRVTLRSVGVRGRGAGPSPALMRRLAAAGTQTLRTDRQSNVVVSTDGRSLRVEVDGDAWDVPLRPWPAPPLPWRESRPP